MATPTPSRPTKKDISTSKVAPHLQGTRLAYHLKSLLKGPRVTDDYDGLIEKALLDRGVPRLYSGEQTWKVLGQWLKAVNHPLAKAYNWHRVGESLSVDKLVRDYMSKKLKVKNSAVHDEDRFFQTALEHVHPTKGKFKSEDRVRFWDGLQKHVSENLKGTYPKTHFSMERIQRSVTRQAALEADRSEAKDKKGKKWQDYYDLHPKGNSTLKYRKRFSASDSDPSPTPTSEPRHYWEMTQAEYIAARSKYRKPRTPIEHPEHVGLHMAPLSDSGSPLWDLSGTYPDDVYSHKGMQYYGTSEPWDSESWSTILNFRNRPNAALRVYRAVPKTVKGKGNTAIKPGDWVTTSKRYAINHGKSALNGEYRVLSKVVKARDLFTNGDSWHEWGYDPQPEHLGYSHRGHVAYALAKGKPVPEHVLADYPDLVSKYGKKSYAAYKAPPGGLTVRGLTYPGGSFLPDLETFGSSKAPVTKTEKPTETPRSKLSKTEFRTRLKKALRESPVGVVNALR
jgi:hypothetical protein